MEVGCNLLDMVAASTVIVWKQHDIRAAQRAHRILHLEKGQLVADEPTMMMKPVRIVAD